MSFCHFAIFSIFASVMTNLTKQLNHLSFRLTGFILAAVLLCFLAGGICSLYRVYHTTMRETHSYADVSLKTATEALDHRLAQVETATKSMTQESALITSDPQSAYAMLQKLLDRCSYISAATLMFRDNYYPQIGHEYAPSIKKEFMKDRLEDDDIKYGFRYLHASVPDVNWIAGLKGKSVWCQPYRQSLPPKNVRVAFSTPIYDKSHEFIGVLCSTIETGWVYDEIKRAIKGNDAEIRVMHTSGLYFCHPQQEMLMKNAYAIAMKKKDNKAIDILNHMSSGKKGFLETTTDDRKLYTYFAPLERAKWIVAISYPKDQVFATANDLTKRLIFTQLSVILLLLLLIPLGVFLIVKPFLLRVKDYTEKSSSMERDLEIASKLQLGILPTAGDELTEYHDIDLACRLQPAKMVGGDLYDFFCSDGKLYFCIGDVSGKGVPAALFMAIVRTMFRDITKYETSPDAIVSQINSHIMQKNTQCMFCTLFVAVLHTDTGILEYCNAGHNPPIICHTDSNGTIAEYTPQSECIPVGVIEEATYSKKNILLNHNDCIFLYTDGITEAENGEARLFGEERTLEVIRQNSHKSADGIIAAMLESVQGFSHDVQQSDDICMICIKKTTNPNKSL